MANPVNQAFSAARGIIKLNGVQIGWATGFRAEESYSQFPIDVLGDVYTQTHELVSVKVSGSFERFRIYQAPLAHAVDGEGLKLWYDQNDSTPDLLKYLEKSFTLEDTSPSVTAVNGAGAPANPAVYTIVGWKPMSRSISYSTGSVLVENCSWVAIRLLESQVGP